MVIGFHAKTSAELCTLPVKYRLLDPVPHKLFFKENKSALNVAVLIILDLFVIHVVVYSMVESTVL